MRRGAQDERERRCFLGSNVKDEQFDWAQFNDQGSAPPSMEGARAVDAASLLKGYSAMQSDAISAYTQAFLKGPLTYVSLPKAWWPADWHGKYTNPVVPLVLALYGHPDSGTFWEERCTEAVTKCGWRALNELGWDGLFWHPEEKALLVVYVDDC